MMVRQQQVLEEGAKWPGRVADLDLQHPQPGGWGRIRSPPVTPQRWVCAENR